MTKLVLDRQHASPKSTAGFTLIEIVIVVGILVLIALVAVSAFSRFNEESALDRAGREVVSALSDARSRTLASQGDTAYGVYFENDRVVRFTGTSYSAGASGNRASVLPSGTVISDILLEGGGSAVVFQKRDGEASTRGVVMITHTAANATGTISITIEKSGLIEATKE